MAQTLFTEELKTRVPPDLKARIEAEADRQQVKSSHVVRQAVREYLEKAPAPKKTRK